MDFGLAGRVALVTGSSRGLGQGIAELLAAEGARVAVTYRQDRARAEAVAGGIGARGGHAQAVYFDLGSVDSMHQARDRIAATWGPIDVLVNNAVALPRGAGLGAEPDARPHGWQQSLRDNIEGAYAAIDTVVPGMRAARWGRIVNVSSIWATDGMPGFAWYSAAKAALHGLSRTLAKELGPAGILVNVVMPTMMLTDRVRERFPAALRERQGRALPIRRLLAPAEVAAAAVFLCSAANTAITGEVIRVSGGRP